MNVVNIKIKIGSTQRINNLVLIRSICGISLAGRNIDSASIVVQGSVMHPMQTQELCA